MKLDSTSLNLSGAGLVLRKTAVQQNAQFKKISDTYSEFAKLVFLFDVSGSMNARIATDKHGSSYATEFLWPEGCLADIRKRVANLIGNMVMEANGVDSADTVTDAELTSLVNVFLMPPVQLFTDDEDLKSQIIKADLMAFLGIIPDITKKHQEPPTRLGVLRTLAKQEINARFQKYPNSRIAVIPFSGIAAPLFDDGKAEEVDAAIDKLDPHMQIPTAKGMCYMDGGTDIMQAIGEGLEVCRKNPSKVGMHHIIVVSDGGSGINTNWTPILKASGVVLDYIHIGDVTPNQELVMMCKELNGDCVTVNSEMELKEKFALAVNRLMLPPSSVK
jgi:hypothetical protein